SYFWSWDNEYAATLLDRGFIGLILFSFLFLSIVFKSYRKFRSTSVANKDLMAALFSAIIVFVFMMTNVMVFSPQLHFLFWLVVSLALTLGQESNYGVQKTGRLAWQQ
ncbi:MAG: hypothetical protein ACE5H1_11650, partial [Thermodesulfobacteriota bacterium]